MPKANDAQMTQYAAERIRVRAEQLRGIYNALKDDQLAIPDIWERASQGPAWTESRSDGPPKILGNGDVLAFNVVIGVLIKCFEGTATAADISALASNWAVVRAACVRAL